MARHGLISPLEAVMQSGSAITAKLHHQFAVHSVPWHLPVELCRVLSSALTALTADKPQTALTADKPTCGPHEK